MGLVVVLPFVLLWMRRRRAEMWRCLYSRGGVWIGAWNHDLRLYGYEVQGRVGLLATIISLSTTGVHMSYDDTERSKQLITC